MSGILSGGGKTFTCKHLLQGAPDCVFCHRDQLKQENAQLREALLRLSVSAQRLSEEAALALARGAEPQTDKHSDGALCLL